MRVWIRTVAVLLLSSVTGSGLSAREWTDASGTYKFDGDLIAATEDTIVLRRMKGELEAYETKQLSEADREFVKQHLEEKKTATNPEEMQTWTGRDGYKIRGRVIGYGRQSVTLTHERGKTTINKKPIEEIDQFYQFMIPKIVAEYDDEKVKTVEDLSLWGRKLRGKQKTFAVDGVLMRLENAEKVAVPLFLFSPEERDLLEQGWDKWAAETTKEDEKRREEFLAQAAANEYQQQRDAANQRIQMMQLEMLAVNAGIAQIWEVVLVPQPGVPARPMSVMVPAQDSQAARLLAQQRYQGFVAGAVRQVSF
jgi:hypothetical protein